MTGQKSEEKKDNNEAWMGRFIVIISIFFIKFVVLPWYDNFEKENKRKHDEFMNHSREIFEAINRKTATLTETAQPQAMTGSIEDLIHEAYRGDAVSILSLLEKGADVNAKRASDGVTVLMMASKDSRGEVVQVLLDKGADINARDNDGMTALMMAAKNGHSAIVQKLIARGADINLKANNGGTALTIATDGKVKALLRQADRKL